MLKRTLLFIVFALLAISCLDQPDCFSLDNNYVGISFKKLSNNTADTVAVLSLTADGTEEIFYDSVEATGLDVPLNPFKNSTVIRFEGPDQQVRNLTLKYSSKAQFVSEDCGERFVLSDLQAFSEEFDSVRVSAARPNANKGAGTNIEIFRCPDPNLVKIRFIADVDVVITGIQTNYASIVPPAEAVTSPLVLPLDINEPQSTISFTFSDGSTKDLVLKYTRASETLYNACGEQVFISNITAEGKLFGAVKVIRPAINDPNQTNIEIKL